MLKGWINLDAIYLFLVLCLSYQIMEGVNKPYTHEMKLKYLNSHTFLSLIQKASSQIQDSYPVPPIQRK